MVNSNKLVVKSKTTRHKSYLFLIFIVLFFYRCKATASLSKLEKYLDNNLNMEHPSKKFEDDSEKGYMKLGNFFNSDKRNIINLSPK